MNHKLFHTLYIISQIKKKVNKKTVGLIELITAAVMGLSGLIASLTNCSKKNEGNTEGTAPLLLWVFF